MIIFHHFLHCISLKSFGKLIGWFGAMAAVLAIYAVFLVLTAKTVDLLALNERYFGGERSSQDVFRNVAFTIVSLIVIGLLHILLLFGVKNKKSNMILPYVIFSFIPIIALIYFMLTTVNFSALADLSLKSFVPIASFLGAILFSVYYSLCVCSLYSLIREDERTRKVYKTCNTIIVAM